MGNIKLSSSGPNVKQLSEETQPLPESSKSVLREGKKEKELKKRSLSEMNDADSTLGDFMKTFVLH